MSQHPWDRRAAVKPIVIVPTYNERANLTTLLPAILRDPRLHVLVVDDNSPDGTSQLVEEMTDTYPGRLFLLTRPEKRGLGTAYLAGFRWALDRDYDLICEMDADYSHDPAMLPRLVAAAQDADLVLGSRYVRGGGTSDWSALRRLVSRLGSLYARLILGLPYQDLTGGFKCFRRRVLESLDLDEIRSTGYAFQIELTYRAHRAGFRITEIPIVFAERRAGTSKMSFDIMLEALVRVWQLRLGGIKRAPLSREMPTIHRVTRPR